MLIRLHSGEEGNWSEATVLLTTETIPTLERQNAHAELGKAWRLVALVQQVAGQLGKACEAISKVVAHARIAGDDRLVARSSLGLTFSALYGPTPVDQAIKQCEHLITSDLGDRQVEGLIMCKLAQLRAMAGEFETARFRYTQGRSLLRDLGENMRLASTSIDVALVELMAGDADAAEKALRPDYDALVHIGETYFLSTMAALLAWALREQGRDDDALRMTESAEALAASDDVEAQIWWRSIRAPILARRGAEKDAEALARAAVEAALGTEHPSLQATALCNLAWILQYTLRIDEAKSALREAVRISELKGDTVSTTRAKRMLQTLSIDE
jgi:tetratricopeptide (TPR) repeat protein